MQGTILKLPYQIFTATGDSEHKLLSILKGQPRWIRHRFFLPFLRRVRLSRPVMIPNCGPLHRNWKLYFLLKCSNKPALASRAKLSAGGGVFPRAAKSIALTPEIKALLGLAVEPLALRAPRGALWGSLVLLLAVLAIETGRWWRGVRIFVDGAEVKTVEPWPPLEFEDRQLTVRSRDQEG
jgi:hypothetical protein